MVRLTSDKSITSVEAQGRRISIKFEVDGRPDRIRVEVEKELASEEFGPVRITWSGTGHDSIDHAREFDHALGDALHVAKGLERQIANKTAWFDGIDPPEALLGAKDYEMLLYLMSRGEDRLLYKRGLDAEPGEQTPDGWPIYGLETLRARVREIALPTEAS